MHRPGPLARALTLALLMSPPAYAGKDKAEDATPAKEEAPKEAAKEAAKEGAKGARQECAAFPVVLVLNAQNVETGARDGTILPTGWTAVGGSVIEGRPVAIACRTL
jgi:hypothetical protein